MKIIALILAAELIASGRVGQVQNQPVDVRPFRDKISVRMLVSWRLSPEQRAKEQNVQVGLWGIGDDDWDMSLSMHEACNKIIHADEFMFETRKVRRAALTYIRDDTILATGTKGRQHWTISLWIAEFCEAAIDMPLVDGFPFPRT